MINAEGLKSEVLKVAALNSKDGIERNIVSHLPFMGGRQEQGDHGLTINVGPASNILTQKSKSLTRDKYPELNKVADVFTGGMTGNIQDAFGVPKGEDGLKTKEPKRTMFNRYQTLNHPTTGTNITVETDNTLWTKLFGTLPWKYIDKANRRYRKTNNGYEVLKFDNSDGRYYPVGELDEEYWNDYVTELEKELPNVLAKNSIQHLFKRKHGGLLMRQGGKIIEVPFN